jgi:hypothetical protein
MVRWWHPQVRITCCNAAEQFTVSRLAGDNRCLSGFTYERARLIESQPPLPREFIESVALPAVICKDGAHVAIELDCVLPICAAGLCQRETSNQNAPSSESVNSGTRRHRCRDRTRIRTVRQCCSHRVRYVARRSRTVQRGGGARSALPALSQCGRKPSFVVPPSGGICTAHCEVGRLKTELRTCRQRLPVNEPPGIFGLRCFVP